MPVISESLSVWEIAHRWANYDPDIFRFRLPLLVKDYSRLLFEAIINGDVYCETLTLAKLPSGSKADPKFYIRSHLDAVNFCRWGVRYDRKILKWATISRDDFEEWCEGFSMPLPEFWFPTGWNRDFERPEFGGRALWAYHVEPEEVGDFSVRFDVPGTRPDEILQEVEPNPKAPALKANQKAKINVQRLAAQLWEEYPDRNIAEMLRDERIKQCAGAAHYTDGAIRKWLQQVAPINIKGKRGRPRKKPDEDIK